MSSRGDRRRESESEQTQPMETCEQIDAIAYRTTFNLYTGFVCVCMIHDVSFVAWQLYLTKRRIEFNWREGKLRPEKVLRGHDEHVVSPCVCTVELERCNMCMCLSAASPPPVLPPQVTCLKFHDNRIVSGSDDSTLKVWHATTGKVSQKDTRWCALSELLWAVVPSDDT